MSIVFNLFQYVSICLDLQLYQSFKNYIYIGNVTKITIMFN